MSAFDSPKSLVAAQAQLPVSWYFDDALLALEKQVFFDQGIGQQEAQQHGQGFAKQARVHLRDQPGTEQRAQQASPSCGQQ